MKKGDLIWLLKVETESGYHASFVFAERPSEEETIEFLEENMGDDFPPDEEDRNGPGDWGSWCYHLLEETEIN